MDTKTALIELKETLAELEQTCSALTAAVQSEDLGKDREFMHTLDLTTTVARELASVLETQIEKL